MKKLILVTFLLLVNTAFAGTSTDAQLLKEKLATFKQVNAHFSQLVTSSDGKVLNQSEGTLMISRPGKFRWEVKTPEEELIVSDGVTMWMYSPFIEQVTVFNLSDAVTGTPFVLLSGATPAQWLKYQVKKQGEQFIIKSKDADAQHNSFVFEFDNAGNISRFIVVEEQGQRSEFTLDYSDQKISSSANYFIFTIPQGVDIDDQR